MRTGRAIPPAKSKRALYLAGTPIFDSVVHDLKFDPAAAWVEEPVVQPTPKTVAKRVTKRTPKNPKVSV